MPATFFALRLALALVFGLAGATKLLDQRRFRATLRDFGLDESRVAATGFLVPGLELVTSGLILPTATAVVGAGLSIVLLLLFSAAMVVVLRRGDAPDCGCFGSLASSEVGAKAIGRNVLLVVVALVSALGAGGSLHVPGLAGVVVPVVSLVVVALAHRRPAGEPRGLPVARAVRPAASTTVDGEASHAEPGSAPAFSLAAISGETIALADLLARGLPVVLVFASPDCRRCQALDAHLSTWQGRYAATLTLAVISRGDPDANRHLADAHGLRYVLLQKDREVAVAYGMTRTPAVVWVSPSGRVEATAGPDPDTIGGVILAAALEGRMAAAGTTAT